MSDFSGVRIYHGRVPGFHSLQVIRDGISQFVSTVPLRPGTAVHAIFCTLLLLFCFFHGDAFCRLLL